ncbi:hypothetical protein NKH69_09660 [Mesorhizobium sp. M0976]|uniref:hypothetical protein n=1 Tax=unclassified Mesorhizobium TaxID=325217 RepID=UPI00333CB4C0
MVPVVLLGDWSWFWPSSLLSARRHSLSNPHVVASLTLAFGDASGRFRRLIQIAFGSSIGFAARSQRPVPPIPVAI